MHGKEQVLSGLFADNLEARLVLPVGMDTDKFGTFSGEIERSADVKSVLRRKAHKGMERLGLEYGLASEGSFSSQPWLPFLGNNQESLLFVDARNEIEIFANVVNPSRQIDFCEAESESDVINFCRRVGCGSQGVILKPDYNHLDPAWIFKGIINELDAVKIFHQIQEKFESKKIWIETDHRSHFSPKRQKVIFKAGEKLMGSLMSQCPRCHTPGFQMSDYLRGLVCSGCGLKSNKAEKEIWTCLSQSCDYNEIRNRLDGIKSLDPSQCHWCNP